MKNKNRFDNADSIYLTENHIVKQTACWNSETKKFDLLETFYRRTRDIMNDFINCGRHVSIGKRLLVNGEHIALFVK